MKEKKIILITNIIESIYHSIKANFQVIKELEKRTWGSEMYSEGKNEQQEIEKQAFIASRKWDIKNDLEEIRMQNDKLKNLIHE